MPVVASPLAALGPLGAFGGLATLLMLSVALMYIGVWGRHSDPHQHAMLPQHDEPADEERGRAARRTTGPNIGPIRGRAGAASELTAGPNTRPRDEQRLGAGRQPLLGGGRRRAAERAKERAKEVAGGRLLGVAGQLLGAAGRSFGIKGRLPSSVELVDEDEDEDEEEDEEESEAEELWTKAYAEGYLAAMLRTDGVNKASANKRSAQTASKAGVKAGAKAGAGTACTPSSAKPAKSAVAPSAARGVSSVSAGKSGRHLLSRAAKLADDSADSSEGSGSPSQDVPSKRSSAPLQRSQSGALVSRCAPPTISHAPPPPPSRTDASEGGVARGHTRSQERLPYMPRGSCPWSTVASSRTPASRRPKPICTTRR